jgi:2-dehydro-3-deoxyphosphogluconate aldolase/(4S)-4-hydroxy-2-oxoglutarate aldolase
MALRIAASKALLRTTVTTSATRTFSTSLDRMQTKESYDAVLQKFAEIRACAVLRTATSEACPKAMQAAIDGGFKICEFTLTTPDALEHVATFRQKYDGDVMIGCGTILTIEDAEAAVDAGCKLIK